MSKLWNYFGILSMVLIVFYIFGLLKGGILDTFITLLIDPMSMTSSYLYGAIFVAVGAAAIGAATIVSGYRIDLSIYAVFVLFFLVLGFQIVQVIGTLFEVNSLLGIVIGGPTMFLFMITVLEWWRGTDY
jgi:hypothetical protein